jgi:DNA-binding NarL/FixJ family response regulator
MSITVMLADDHTIVREGMRSLLKAEADIKVVAEAEDGREAVRLVISHRPDVVVMDIAMPLLNGLEATRQILAVAPSTRVLILSAHCDDAYVEHVMALGAAGYLLKQSSSNMIAEAIRQVHQGEDCFTTSISKHLRRRGKILPVAGSSTTTDLQLTPRELEVLQLVAEGILAVRTFCDFRNSETSESGEIRVPSGRWCRVRRDTRRSWHGMPRNP